MKEKRFLPNSFGISLLASRSLRMKLHLFSVVMPVSSLVLFTMSASCVRAEFVFEFGSNRYEVITTPTDWVDAAAIATSRTFNGVQGSLVRIDSEAENDEIINQMLANLTAAEIDMTRSADGQDFAYVWIGATDAQQEGVWLWDGDGDGIGDQFWNGTFRGNAVGGLYQNWGTVTAFDIQLEPDNSGDLQDGGTMALEFFNRGDAGEWNDVDAVNNDLFFIVEYQDAAAVPEPNSLMLLALGVTGVGLRRRFGFRCSN